MTASRGIRFQPTPERLRAIAEAYRQEQAIYRTARRMKCSYRTVRRALEANGIRPLSQSEAQSGPRNPSWRGGRILVGRYWYIHRPSHPHATGNGYVAEHRLLMEGVLGRTLLPGEVVHHKDGNPRNNDPANLELFASNGEHLSHELKGRAPRRSEDGMRRVREGGRRGGKSPRRNRRPKNDGPA